jgi:predicted RNase H-like nuclease (RuvC/YqgF family)
MKARLDQAKKYDQAKNIVSPILDEEFKYTGQIARYQAHQQELEKTITLAKERVELVSNRLGELRRKLEHEPALLKLIAGARAAAQLHDNKQGIVVGRRARHTKSRDFCTTSDD